MTARGSSTQQKVIKLTCFFSAKRGPSFSWPPKCFTLPVLGSSAPPANQISSGGSINSIFGQLTAPAGVSASSFSRKSGRAAVSLLSSSAKSQPSASARRIPMLLAAAKPTFRCCGRNTVFGGSLSCSCATESLGEASSIRMISKSVKVCRCRLSRQTSVSCQPL